MTKIDHVTFTRDTYQPYFAFWKQFLEEGQDGFYFAQHATPPGETPAGAFAQCTFEVDSATSRRLCDLVNGQDNGLLVIFLSAFGLLLNKYTEREQCIVATPLYASPAREPRYADQVPVFVRTPAASTLREVFAGVQAGLKAFYQYQNFPLSLLDGAAGRPEVYGTNVLLVYEGLHEPYGDAGPHDLVLRVKRNPGSLTLSLTYRTAAFDALFAEGFRAHLLDLLMQPAHLSQPVGAFTLSPSVDQARVLESFNATGAPFPVTTVTALFEQAVRRNPGAIALVHQGGKLTYGELDAQAAALAAHLKNALGVGPESLVALMAGKSPALIIGMLGIMKAGAAYLPIDPDYPDARKQYLLEDSGAPWLLTESAYLFDLEGYAGQVFALDVQLAGLPVPAHPPVAPVAPDHLAYVIYTSGSSGAPKGVMIEHRSCVNMALAQIDAFGITAGDAVLQFASISFDASVSEIFKTFLAGATLVLPGADLAADPAKLLAYLRATGVSVVTFPPSYLALLPLEQLSFLRVVISAGEAANPGHARAVSRYAQYYNAYGPTECTVCVSIDRFDPDRTENALAIGRPIANVQVHLRTGAGAPTPPGLPGELCVTGAGLARGYLNRPELTAEKFVADPGAPGRRLYHTGDLARWLPDGRLRFLGRKDFQVKVRGYRVEPEEIEKTMLLHPLVKEAAVVSRPAATGETEIRAYFTAGAPLQSSDLKAFLAARLPAYLLPATLVRLASFGHTAAGKIDRSALPDPQDVGRENEYAAPQDPLQERLAAVWQETLGRGPIGVDDNFFSVGGDSIKAIRLAVAINQALDASLEVNDIFTAGTIRELAALLNGQGGRAAKAEGLAAARAEVEDFRRMVSTHPRLAPRLPADWEDIFPMSDIQTGMVYHSLLGADANIYKEQMFFQVEDATFSPDAFTRAVNLLVRKHPILRTSFLVAEDVMAQVVHAYAWSEGNICIEDLSGRRQEAAKRRVEECLEEDKRRRFALDGRSLWRMRVFRLPHDEFAVLFTCNHAMVDGWSNASLMTELSNAYFTLKAGQAFPAADLKATYKDYIVEQLYTARSGAVRTYWQEVLDGYRKTALPFSRTPRFSLLESQVANHTFSLPDDLGAGLLRLNEAGLASVKHLFLAAFMYLVKLTTGEEDLTVGLVTNGRPEIPDGDRIIGCFTNTVPFRLHLPHRVTAHDWVREVDRQAGRLKAFDKLSLIEIMKLIGEETRDHNPVFDLIFNYVDFHIYERRHRDSVVKDTLIDEQNRGNTNTLFDFTVCRVSSTGHAFFVNLNYQDGLYTRAELDRLVTYYTRILQLIVQEGHAHLSSLKVLPGDELQRLLALSRPPRTPYPDASLAALFEAQAARTPDAVAVVCTDLSLTYGALNQKANQLANHLRAEYGVQPNDLVGIMARRSEAVVIGILGIVKAGGAYLPVEVQSPPERKSQMLGAGVKVLLTESEWVFAGLDYYPGPVFALDLELPGLEAGPGDNPAAVNRPADLAYLMHTSGSTGQPKGVLVEQKSVINLVHDPHYVRLAEGERLLQTGALAFDATTFELWGTLLHGGELHLLPDEDLLAVATLKRTIARSRITTMWFTASWFHQLVESDLSLFAPLRQVLAGGDKLSPHHVQQVRNRYPHLHLVNGYGPTENTTFSLCHVIDRDYPLSVPIGRPVGNGACYLLDAAGQPVPVGVQGELYVGGDGLARGYRQDPELTGRHFVASPFGKERGERLYRTGDYGKWLPDGTVEFGGRRDSQVKIRGYRVELGEIEAALRRHESVAEALVRFTGAGSEDRQLVAYVTTRRPVTPAALAAFLKEQLPAPMIPAHLVALDDFPLTRNGKVNHKALPVPDAQPREELPAPPATEVEKCMLAVWEGVTGRKHLGIRDNFFAIGGDSIKAIQVSSRLQQEGYKVEVKDIFLFPTVEELAREARSLVRVADQSPVAGEVPLTPVQRQFCDGHRRSPHHFNQAVLLTPARRLPVAAVAAVFEKLWAHHDMLRATFPAGERVVQRVQAPQAPPPVEEADFRNEARPLEKLEAACARMQGSINLQTGPVLKVGLFHLPEDDRLFIVIHHLVVDGVSWRILLEDLETLCGQYESGQLLSLPPKTDSFQHWAHELMAYARSAPFLREAAYWRELHQAQTDRIPLRAVASNVMTDAVVTSLELDETLTQALLTQANAAFNTEINDLLLSALGLALGRTFPVRELVIALEGHGREEILADVNVSRTVGWFTSVFPIVLALAETGGLAGFIKQTKERLRAIPNKGIGYGVWRYLSGEAGSAGDPASAPQVCFNYLGQFDADIGNTSFAFAHDPVGYQVAPGEERVYDLDITGLVLENRLTVTISCNPGHFGEPQVAAFCDALKDALAEVTGFCTGQSEADPTPSDFTYGSLSLDQLDAINQMLD